MITSENFFKLVRLIIGNAWNKAALFLIIGGIAAINGWMQYVVAALWKISIQDTPTWVGFSLVGIGVLVLLGNRLIPERPPTTLSEDDLRLAGKIREMLTDPTFLRAFRESRETDSNPFDDFLARADNVRFDSPDLQAEFDDIVRRARSLRKVVEIVGRTNFIALIPLPYHLIVGHLASAWLRLKINRFAKLFREDERTGAQQHSE